MSEISEGARAAAEQLATDLREGRWGSFTAEHVEKTIQRLAVAPVEAERDALRQQVAELSGCHALGDAVQAISDAAAQHDMTIEDLETLIRQRDEARAELERVRQEEREACARLAERSRTGPPCPFDAPADRTPPADKPCSLCGQDSSGQGGHTICVAFHEGAKLAAAIRNRSTEGEG